MFYIILFLSEGCTVPLTVFPVKGSIIGSGGLHLLLDGGQVCLICDIDCFRLSKQGPIVITGQLSPSFNHSCLICWSTHCQCALIWLKGTTMLSSIEPKETIAAVPRFREETLNVFQHYSKHYALPNAFSALFNHSSPS